MTSNINDPEQGPPKPGAPGEPGSAGPGRDATSEPPSSAGNPPRHSTTDRVASAAHEAVDRAAERGANAEERIRASSEQAAERAREARRSATERYQRARNEAGTQADDWYYQMCGYVRENPVASLGMALGAGFLVGSILRRR